MTTKHMAIVPTAAAALIFALAGPLQAQSTATVHGHLTNPAGTPQTTGEVKFTKDKTVEFKDEKFITVVPVDAKGDYSATNVAPGDYFVYVIAEGKTVDRLDLTVKAGDDKTLDFDMTRAEYLKGMSEEQKKALEDYKKRNAEVTNANVVINKLNGTLKTVRADLTAANPTKGDVSADVASMKQAVDAKGDVALLWLTYGDTLQAQGDHISAEDKKASKPSMSDPDVLKNYSDAADAYKKGIELDTVAKKPNPVDEAVGYNQLGNVLAKSGKTSDAATAFEGAAKADPAKSGMYYNNEAAVMFNANQSDGALSAAEKAIAADPTRPDPYYVKGQILVQKAALDPKTNKLVAPPGCLDAYQSYVSLAPNGAHVSEVKEILAAFGEKIDTSYRAGKKR